MSPDEATLKAREFAIQHRCPVLLAPLSVRHMKAKRFNDLFDREVYPSDFWVVEFLKINPPGVAAETPGSILVEVWESTGRVREAYVGMWADDAE
jgi:hypothetical protein